MTIIAAQGQTTTRDSERTTDYVCAASSISVIIVMLMKRNMTHDRSGGVYHAVCEIADPSRLLRKERRKSLILWRFPMLQAAEIRTGDVFAPGVSDGRLAAGRSRHSARENRGYDLGFLCDFDIYSSN
jgi:hypothetical protein